MRSVRSTALRFMLVAAAATGLGGCYGSFNAVKKLHAWNGTLGDGVVTQVAFWALALVQVYTLFALGDTFVLNVIEFWTGGNPLADADDVRVIDGRIAFERDGRSYRIEPVDEATLRVEVDGLHVGDAEIQPDGGLLIRDRHTGESVLLTPEQLRAHAPTPTPTAAAL